MACVAIAIDRKTGSDHRSAQCQQASPLPQLRYHCQTRDYSGKRRCQAWAALAWPGGEEALYGAVHAGQPDQLVPKAVTLRLSGVRY
jgi:hypothetical protein